MFPYSIRSDPGGKFLYIGIGLDLFRLLSEFVENVINYKVDGAFIRLSADGHLPRQ
jgi:hypothetical protein